MIIDSGADISIIPYTLGEDLGLHLDMEKRRDARVEARVGWALTDDVPLILGRLDIFRSFVIEFRELEGKIIFRRRDMGSQQVHGLRTLLPRLTLPTQRAIRLDS